MVGALRALLGALLSSAAVAGDCAALNGCSGHGRCDGATSTCACFDGWGSATDVAAYKAPDCSLRTCPSDRAWVDVPSGPASADAHASAECSNAGLCDRASGRCRCFAGFEGEACQRSACPSANAAVCSGHGRCVSVRQSAGEPTAQAFGASPGGAVVDPTGWDADKLYGCVCDSEWAVGYGPGQMQAAQFYGADCSLARCPSADDPRTADVDETDCEFMDGNGAIWRGFVGSDGRRYKAAGDMMPAGVTVAATPGASTRKADALEPGEAPNAGAAGNRCHVECASRGVCEPASGTCRCFVGYYGAACGSRQDFLG